MRAGRIAALALAMTIGVAACAGQSAAPQQRPAGPASRAASSAGTQREVALARSAVPAAAKVRRAPNACAHNRAPQKIIVSIARQHMWLCAWHRLVRDNPVTTGMATRWTRTPTGNFQVQYRVRNTTLTLNTGATYAVKYWIPFQGPLYGFHDSSWQKFPYGSSKYKTRGSHGCVHMPLRAIAFLYRWTARPTAVHIS